MICHIKFRPDRFSRFDLYTYIIYIDSIVLDRPFKNRTRKKKLSTDLREITLITFIPSFGCIPRLGLNYIFYNFFCQESLEFHQ